MVSEFIDKKFKKYCGCLAFTNRKFLCHSSENKLFVGGPSCCESVINKIMCIQLTERNRQEKEWTK